MSCNVQPLTLDARSRLAFSFDQPETDIDRTLEATDDVLRALTRSA